MMKQVKLMILTIAISINLSANSWNKMLTLYSTAKSYSMNVKVELKVADENQMLSYTGTVRQSGANYYSNIQGITTVYGPDHWIVAYDHSKTMYYGKSNEAYRKSLIHGQKEFADSLLKMKNMPKLISSNAGQDVYKSEINEGLYQSAEYTVSAATGYLLKVIYRYRNNQDLVYEYTEISYSEITVNQPIESSWFATKTYFTFKKNDAIGTGRFAAYRIINQDASIPKQ